MKSLTLDASQRNSDSQVVRRTWEKIQKDAKGCQEHYRTKESVTVTKSLSRRGGSRPDRLGTTAVYVESKGFM